MPVRCVANVDDVLAFLGADERYASERDALLAHQSQNVCAGFR